VVLRVLQVLLERLVPPVLLELLEQVVHQVLQVHQELADHRDHLDPQVHLDLQVHLGQVDLQDLQDPQAHPGLVVLLVQVDRLEPLVLLGLAGPLAPQAHQEQAE